MYHINTHLKGKTRATSDDFPLLRMHDAEFVMWRSIEGYHIQTMIGDIRRLKSLARQGEKHLKDRCIFLSKY